MLHVDLWLNGLNVLRDGGSYRYYDAGGLGKWFQSTAAHNTIEIDGEDQMIPGPRFLWFRWTQSRLRPRPGGNPDCVVGEHDGYGRLGVTHRRALLRAGDAWVIVDDLLGRGRHRAVLRWRLCNGPWQSGEPQVWRLADPRIAIRVRSDQPTALHQGDDHPPQGWESLHYGQRRPSPTLVTRVKGEFPIRFITLIAPGQQADLELNDGKLRLMTDTNETLISLA